MLITANYQQNPGYHPIVFSHTAFYKVPKENEFKPLTNVTASNMLPYGTLLKFTLSFKPAFETQKLEVNIRFTLFLIKSIL